MSVLDRVLGLAELLAVPVSTALLLRACLAPSKRRARVATLCALAVAITVAQPFGIVATRTASAPKAATRSGPGGVHTIRAFGLLPIPYTIYRRPVVYESDSSPRAHVRARSWLWLPLLTNGADVAGVCSNSVQNPCWEPHATYRGDPYATDFTIATRDNDQWAVFNNPFSKEHPHQVPAAYVWRLRFGLASPAGLAYWIGACVLSLIALRRSSRRPGRTAP